MIGTLLVANRGEIALRVMRSAQRRGLRTVAVYSDADRGAPHVRAADAAVHLGPTPASASYLNIEALLAAAERSGADAVHPGYGFLSERADFAQAVTGAGLVFVGPPARVIEAMGRKDHARALAERAGVPVVPRFVPPTDKDLSEATADESGFPVLVKAVAGGGGKGMRVVRHPADLEAAVAAARRESAAAFGDDSVLLERFLEHGRHVEVQVLADHHGEVVHLWERDCSAQRRHQKVLEEAPGPRLDPAVRTVLLASAVALAREVGYQNAGTVEFLVAGPPGAQHAYFLEMNTRLQVEHPVTEAVVRVAGRPLDLVEQQLRVADGEPLGYGQDDITCTGHALEARVYAEDAFAGFLPQAGTARLVRWSPQARVDTALESGGTVGTAYDPMIAKVVAAGPTREAARAALVTALDDSAVLGLTTNLGFLRGLVASAAFRDHEVDTEWLDTTPEPVRRPDPSVPALVAAWALARGLAPAPTRPRLGAFGRSDGWRSAGPPAPVVVTLEVAGRPTVLAVHAERVCLDGHEHVVLPVSVEAEGDGAVVRLEVDGRVEEATVLVEPWAVQVAHHGHTFVLPRPDANASAGAAVATDGSVTAPMPGTVLSVAVTPGTQVAAGQLLGVLEAMKMELSVTAPVAGEVTAVGAAPGEQVALGAELFHVTAAPEPA